MTPWYVEIRENVATVAVECSLPNTEAELVGGVGGIARAAAVPWHYYSMQDHLDALAVLAHGGHEPSFSAALFIAPPACARHPYEETARSYWYRRGSLQLVAKCWWQLGAATCDDVNLCQQSAVCVR